MLLCIFDYVFVWVCCVFVDVLLTCFVEMFIDFVADFVVADFVFADFVLNSESNKCH